MVMKVKSSVFVSSSADFKACPSDDKAEFAFIGRSNVGKSSLINMLLSRKSLAKTSSKPGKTQTINHFLVNHSWYIVDLPGYGWAKASKKSKKLWEKMISEYLKYRANLVNVFVLIDARRLPQNLDIDFMTRLGKNNIPFSIIFTKCDKQTHNKTKKHMELLKQELLNDWEELPLFLFSSAEKGDGKKEILGYIDSLIKNLDN